MNHAQRTAAFVRRFVREQRPRLQVQAWLIAFDPHWMQQVGEEVSQAA